MSKVVDQVVAQYFTVEQAFTLLLRLPPSVRISDKEFMELCLLNDGLLFERTGEGDLVIMTPEGSESGNRGFELTAAFTPWVKADGTGLAFWSSTCPGRPHSQFSGTSPVYSRIYSPPAIRSIA